jgi:NAD(P)-dependent dehydrogenase (short-subunit alcohol dehydrogenase family)
VTADGELNDRRALVTGGTKGVGEAALRDAGASVLTKNKIQSDQRKVFSPQVQYGCSM